MPNAIIQLQFLLGLDDTATYEDVNSLFGSMCTYDKALICNKALAEGYFPSARRFAVALYESDYKNMGPYITLGAMPSSFVDAFENKNSIQVKWIRKLKASLTNDPDIVLFKSKEVQRLRGLGEKWPAARVYKYLTSNG